MIDIDSLKVLLVYIDGIVLADAAVDHRAKALYRILVVIILPRLSQETILVVLLRVVDILWPATLRMRHTFAHLHKSLRIALMHGVARCRVYFQHRWVALNILFIHDIPA